MLSISSTICLRSPTLSLVSILLSVRWYVSSFDDKDATASMTVITAPNLKSKPRQKKLHQVQERGGNPKPVFVSNCKGVSGLVVSHKRHRIRHTQAGLHTSILLLAPHDHYLLAAASIINSTYVTELLQNHLQVVPCGHPRKTF